MICKHTTLGWSARSCFDSKLAPRRDNMEVRCFGLRDVVAEFSKNSLKVELPKALVELLGLKLLHKMGIAGREPRTKFLEHSSRRSSTGSV